MTIALATTAFKTGQLTGTVSLLTDTIKARIGSNTDFASANPTLTTMSTVTKYLNSTDQTLGSKTVSATITGGNDSASLVAFDAADLTFPAQAADGAKTVDWICIYKFVTNDSDSIPYFWLTGFAPLTPTGNAITVQFASSGFRIFSLAN